MTAFGLFWLSQAQRNFFVTDGHYAFGWHFIPVYLRTLVRLIFPAIPFGLAMYLIKTRESEIPWKPLMFFAALLTLSIIPYSFLTYLDHLPSRNTYFPSVGLAGLIGVMFAARLRPLMVSLMVALVAGNLVYIWVKKEPQYRERAAPTRELIDTLNSADVKALQQLPVYVCGFPLHPWVFSEAVAGFTRFNPSDVVLRDNCDTLPAALVLKWNAESGRYIGNVPKLESATQHDGSSQ